MDRVKEESEANLVGRGGVGWTPGIGVRIRIGRGGVVTAVSSRHNKPRVS